MKLPIKKAPPSRNISAQTKTTPSIETNFNMVKYFCLFFSLKNFLLKVGTFRDGVVYLNEPPKLGLGTKSRVSTGVTSDEKCDADGVDGGDVI